MKIISILLNTFERHIIQKYVVLPEPERFRAERGATEPPNESRFTACEMLRCEVAGVPVQDDDVAREMPAAKPIEIKNVREFEHVLRFAGWSRSESIYDARHCPCKKQLKGFK